MYPTDYGFVRDKKGRDWRDIAKIPFIDASALVAAYNAVGSKRKLPGLLYKQFFFLLLLF
jgi:hypothetical protein